MKLCINQKAEEDLRQIEEYIGEDNPNAAVKFVSRLTERFMAVVEFPGIGRKRDEVKAGYRSVTEGDYVILYRQLTTVRIEIAEPLTMPLLAKPAPSKNILHDVL